MTDAPNQDLPDELDDLVEDEDDLAPNQDLPQEKQPPRGKGNNRGKSDQAPGKNKP
jgi:hypothetical protein